MKEGLYNKKDLAAYFNVSVSTIEKWMREGCSVIRLSPGLPRFRVEQVETWLDAQQQIHNDLDK